MTGSEEVKASPGVLVIYTGGTIGSKPRDPDPDSPQVVVSWDELRAGMPEIERLPYVVDGFELPPRDSCNIDPPYWRAIAEAIRDHYNDYTGFVILHGTDTMVYSACVLSFMLRNLDKPVILTGSQRSALVSVRNDATQNLLTALTLANPAAHNLPVVPEVCIFFGGLLLRGNRTRKKDTTGYVAYWTPNVEPLGEAGDQIVVNEKLIRPMPDRNRRFTIRTALDTNVMPLFVYPGIQDTALVDAVLATEGLKAVVVLSFGAGNIPTTDPAFIDAFRKARERGVIVANVSQCDRGPVEQGLYETSAELLEAGFVAADDITLEAAQCKLMVLLGQGGSVEEVEQAFEVDMAGEQSVSCFTTHYPNSGGELGGDATRHVIRGVRTEGQWNARQVGRVLLRLRDAEVVTPGDVPAEFRVFVNLEDDEEPDDQSPSFAGRARKWATRKPGMSMFDVTDTFRATTEAGDRVSFTLVLDTPGAALRWKSAEVAAFVRERVS